MKIRGIVLACAAVAWPAMGLCAEGAEAANRGGSWTALLFYVVNFALFAWLLAKYAGPMARKYFGDRAAAIRETVARADTAFKEAEIAAQHAAQRLAALAADKARFQADFESETAYAVNRMAELPREAAMRIKRDGQLSAAALSEAANRRVRARLAEAATNLARDLIARDFKASDQARLLRNFESLIDREARP